MGQNVIMTGMVLNVSPIGEYDKRITLLTRERGKITAFARGARRQGSALLAATAPFSFGEFEFYEGRSSYTVAKASITNYFRELTADYLATYYGFYFLEMADYYCQENNDEVMMLKLLYQSLRALESPALNNRLVRLIFELKAMAINGEGPNLFSCLKCGAKEGLRYLSVNRGGALCETCAREETERAKRSAITGNVNFFLLGESVLYTMQYVISAKIEKLFNFTVSEPVLAELEREMKEYRAVYLTHTFRSLKILEEMA